MTEPTLLQQARQQVERSHGFGLLSASRAAALGNAVECILQHLEQQQAASTAPVVPGRSSMSGQFDEESNSPSTASAPRLTAGSFPRFIGHAEYPVADGYFGVVYVDGKPLAGDMLRKTEAEARAAAEAYIDELLAYFRAGGT